MEKETMHSKGKLDVADVNHVDLNGEDQPFDAFHDWSAGAQVTPKDKTVCCIEERDRSRRSDSFSEEWQDHTSEVSDKASHQPSELDNAANLDAVNFTTLSKTVFPQCFHSNSCNNSSSCEEKFDPHNNQFWKQLIDSVQPNPFDWSCDHAESYLMTSVMDGKKPTSCHSTPRAMSPDSDSSYFDWSDDGVCSMLLELRVGNVDLESTNYVYSMQISPIELEFDHHQATLGLSVLSIEELNEMYKEMTEKFSRLSEDLIKELQERDVLIRDQEVRNQFVASLMKVEGKKKAVSHAKAQEAANPTSSSKRLVRKAKSTLKKRVESSSDLISQCKFLNTVIPYLQPPNGEWRTKTLQSLIKLLNAMHEDSPSLASLTSEYLTSEVFNSISNSSTDSTNNS